MKYLVCIPTYNEKENIIPIIAAVLEHNPQVEILVVDDNSPDGTGDIVRNLQRAESRVHLLARPGKQGLGKAYLAAFHWGLENGFDFITEMDADFSHRAEDLTQILAATAQADFVVGSRYISGGAVQNWSLIRKLISRGGSLYARLILGFPLRDWTGGFNSWSRKALLGMNLPAVKSEGYSFQIELKFRALGAGFKGVEVPILFEDRRAGQSKMSFKIVIEAFYRVWLMRFKI
jgi:dolichol-phosphate mannosyltransferase